MRLFLASQYFGNHADRLSDMVGENRKALVITNARDYRENKSLDAKRKLFKQNNLDFQELDLREYFGKSDELRLFIDDYQPGLVVLAGGNMFLLRRALYQSGFDKILNRDINDNKYVLAGYSAGSIVVGPDLHGFKQLDNPYLVLPGYQEEVVWDGLGLTDVLVLPHADSPKYIQKIADASALFDRNDWKNIVLNDSDVFVVDGDKEEVLR